jgi:hypothetical protein
VVAVVDMRTLDFHFAEAPFLSKVVGAVAVTAFLLIQSPMLEAHQL